MNTRGLNKVLIFVAGVAIGSAATWQFAKKHYNQVLEDEFTSMQDYFEQKWIEKTDQEIGELKEVVDNFEYTAREMADRAKDKPSVADCARHVVESTYIDYANIKAPKEEPVESVENKSVPYVISPEMVENGGYNLQTLTYYSDGILTDDWNDLENYADDLAGCDFKDHFGDFVEDVVHVRNDELGIDYEITLDPRNYSDIVNPDQHSMEDE